MLGEKCSDVEEFAKANQLSFCKIDWDSGKTIDDTTAQSGSNLESADRIATRYVASNLPQGVPALVELLGRLIDRKQFQIERIKAAVEAHPEKTLVCFSCVDLLEKTGLSFVQQCTSMSAKLFGSDYRPYLDQVNYSASIDAKFTREPMTPPKGREHQRHFTINRRAIETPLLPSIIKQLEMPNLSATVRPPREYWLQSATTALASLALGRTNWLSLV